MNSFVLYKSFQVESQKTAMKENDEGIVLVKDSGKGPKLKREVHWPTRQYDEAYTSLKVNKTHKEVFFFVCCVFDLLLFG